LPQVPEFTARMTRVRRSLGRKCQSSLLISLLTGNLLAETGSTSTASATIKSLGFLPLGHGYNEVAEKKRHPVLKFLGKFWGISAWMLELIMVLSAVLGNYSDLAVVDALLVVNAVLSFMQEQRAAGVVEALRRRLQVSARIRRDSSWQVIPARVQSRFFSLGVR
jgi:magnesium-transporting ATPase (P-type)